MHSRCPPEPKLSENCNKPHFIAFLVKNKNYLKLCHWLQTADFVLSLPVTDPFWRKTLSEGFHFMFAEKKVTQMFWTILIIESQHYAPF